MKNKQSDEVNSKVEVSRRAVLKTVSAAVAGVTLGSTTAAVAAVPPPGSLDYGTVGLWKENVYPLLAAWLALTTSETVMVPSDETKMKSNLANYLGLSASSAQVLWDKFNGPKHGSFIDVRNEFQDLAGKLAQSGSEYSGGICPDVVKPLQDVAALYQPHPSKPK
ncbi:MAG: hypothetical protein ABSG70_09790 [Terriglobales bacterium]|jgi:hypothetical protein